MFAPKLSEICETGRDSKLSGISRALRFVSTLGMRNKGIQICALKLSHSIWDCHNNRHVFPSKAKVRSGSTDNNSTTNFDPNDKYLKSHRRGCSAVYFTMIMKRGFALWPNEKRFEKKKYKKTNKKKTHI